MPHRRNRRELCRSVSRALPLLAGFGFPSGAPAEVVQVSPAGFEVHFAMHVAAAPAKVFAGLILPARWWSPEHTYSQDAANLTLDANPGGCFCEKLRDGSTFEHMHTVMAEPGKRLRLQGALGPFRKLAVEGVLTFTIEPEAGGSALTMTYTIAGSSPGGFDTLAKAADAMLSEQWASLRALLDG